MLHYFFGNTGLAGIFIAAVAVGALAITINSKKGTPNEIGLLLSAFILLFLVYLEARAAIVGYLVALVYLGRLKENPWFQKARSRIVVFAASSMLLLILVSVKQGSSRGRVLVYNVSWNLLCEHWLQGIGWGKFRVAYGLQQAKYFQAHCSMDREAMLADATVYAFNDSWQLLIELGVLRFILLTGLLLLLARQLFLSPPHSSRTKLNRGAKAGLIVICLASLFSYPFQLPAIQLLVLFFFVALFISMDDKGRQRRINLILPLVALVICTTTVIRTVQKFRADLLIERAEVKMQSSLIRESIAAYRSSFDLLPQLASGIPYARALLLIGEAKKAGDVLASLKQIQALPAVFLLSAEVEEQRGAWEKAENDMLLAHYMVPNRLRTRCLLVNFYLRRRDTAAAIRWAENLLLAPVKIRSTEADSYRDYCTKLIKDLAK